MLHVLRGCAEQPSLSCIMPLCSIASCLNEYANVPRPRVQYGCGHVDHAHLYAHAHEQCWPLYGRVDVCAHVYGHGHVRACVDEHAWSRHRHAHVHARVCAHVGVRVDARARVFLSCYSPLKKNLVILNSSGHDEQGAKKKTTTRPGTSPHQCRVFSSP